MTDPRAGVADLVEALTRPEKLSLVSGASDPAGTATGYLPGVDRLDVPAVRLVDGPVGVRVPGKPATAFPASIALAASFDPTLARRQGRALAREALARDQDVLLAPALNLIRVPHGGRNFEYYAEDPVLTGALAAAAVEGIQSDGVVATPKHYVANAQETDRATVSAAVDERALRECYLPGFRAAVSAGAGAVMTAYNRVNGTYASEHPWLLGDVLKGEWGFSGFVVSDWYGTESTVAAATAGLDLEMPGVPVAELAPGDADTEDEQPNPAPDTEETVEGQTETEPARVGYADPARGIPDPARHDYFGEALGDAVADGSVPPSRLDDMVARILGQLDRFGLLDGRERDGALDTPAHRELSATIATRGTVLLENDGTLPIPADADVALVGPNVGEATLGGGGSSETTPAEPVPTAVGVERRAEGAVTVEPGLAPIPDLSMLDLLLSGPPARPSADGTSIDAAARAAADADVAVVVVRDRATEGLDRPDLRLPGRQDDLVAAVADAADRTVVAVQSGGPVELPWRDDVAAVLATWYPGQSDGRALARVLFGDADPSGRLPVTFAPEAAYPATGEPRTFPGVDGRVHHDEGVFVGYRGFDRFDVAPTYPFGHGGSYAAIEYCDAEPAADGRLRVRLANAADRDGRAVVQAYARPPETAVERPVRELAGFDAVGVPAGETVTADVDLDPLAVRRYDADAGWTVDPGTYVLEVGRSSRDCRLTVDWEPDAAHQ